MGRIADGLYVANPLIQPQLPQLGVTNRGSSYNGCARNGKLMGARKVDHKICRDTRKSKQISTRNVRNRTFRWDESRGQGAIAAPLLLIGTKCKGGWHQPAQPRLPRKDHQHNFTSERGDDGQRNGAPVSVEVGRKERKWGFGRRRKSLSLV